MISLISSGLNPIVLFISSFSSNKITVGTLLTLYFRIKKDPKFIQQLMDLYHELQTAQMSFADLEFLEEPEKREDLVKIFIAVTAALNKGDFDSSSQIAAFAQHILAGDTDADLANLALVIDGFTRFSAEEEYLVS